jgi:polysaccharide chain length determinant protein (PEP-CTERM system associated)
LGYIKGVWRYRFHATAVAWFVAIVGWIYIANLSDQYEASARVYVDTESVLKPLLQGMAIDSNVMAQAALTKRALLSKPQLERLAQETGLSQRLSDPSGVSGLIDVLQAKISIMNERGSVNLFKISFIDHDKNMAEKVVKELVDTFVRQVIGENITAGSSAQNFLLDQINEYEKKLQSAEQKLADFKKQNVGLMPGREGDYYARLQGATNSLEVTQTNLKIAVTRRDTLRKQVEGEEPVFGFVGQESNRSGVSNSVSENPKIDRLKAELNTMLLTMTENHPDVIALQRTIETVKKQNANSGAPKTYSVQPSVTLTPEQSMALNPVYQSMQIALSQAEAEVAVLQSKLIEDEKEVNRLKELIDTIPEVEAELARLNRDYTVNQNQYEALLRRLSTAELSQEADRSEEQTKIRIIDPAHVADLPVYPNRPLMVTVVTFGGLFLGIALAFLMSQIKPVFTNHYEIKKSLGVPVLGVVSHLLTEQEQEKKSMLDKALIGSVGALLLTYGLVVVIV